jgi:hypothetical protein
MCTYWLHQVVVVGNLLPCSNSDDLVRFLFIVDSYRHAIVGWRCHR